MKNSFENSFENKTVLITGHTGFKGSWLAIWLEQLGAKVIGYSLDAPTQPSNFSVTKLQEKIVHIHGDVRDYALLKKTIIEHNPDVIFHLAAQPLVLHSYKEPKETFDTNVGGTVNVMEAVRTSDANVKALLMITTDKVYENKEWLWGYRETDALGGSDPYSASKSMAELAVSSYQKSFFKEGNATLLASARAGNVIGGGDFTDSRLIPDTMSALMACLPVEVRNPRSVRPWLHVLDPLSGYLCLAAKLLQGKTAFAEAWNFAPLEQKGITCAKMVGKAIERWGSGEWMDVSNPNAKCEMQLLKLNGEKAASKLDWHPAYDWEEAIQETVDWFKAFQQAEKYAHNMYAVCVDHIQRYTASAQEQQLSWTNLHPIEAL